MFQWIFKTFNQIYASKSPQHCVIVCIKHIHELILSTYRIALYYITLIKPWWIFDYPLQIEMFIHWNLFVDVVVHHTIKRNALRMVYVSINIRTKMLIMLNNFCWYVLLQIQHVIYWLWCVISCVDYSYFHNFLCFTTSKNEFYIGESSQTFLFYFFFEIKNNQLKITYIYWAWIIAKESNEQQH